MVTAEIAVETSSDVSPLFHDGWVAFNARKWGVEPRRVRFSNEGSELPAVEAVYYLDGSGSIWKPPTTPYLPVAFSSTPTQSKARLDRQWLAVGELLAKDMLERGVSGRVALPPEVHDIRPFLWAGFQAEVKYTFYADLPYDDGAIDSAVRRPIAKAKKAGFRCERVTDMGDVFACVDDTQQRQGFSYGMSEGDLQLARALAGDDTFRAYVCYSPEGEPVSARVSLHMPGQRAIDWLAGTKRDYLNSGATQYLLRWMIDDLEAAGATAIDFEGANLPTVASAKAYWGGELVPFYVVTTPHVKAIARHARDYIRFRRRKRSTGA